MPICPVCDSKDFQLLDGLYFCRVCSTQSQEIVEEDVDIYGAPTGKQLGTSRAKGKDGTGNLGKKSHIDKGKPWYTVEGLQVILKAQVDALIRLGCTPELREVVKQIWFKYIHKSGLAVIDPSIKPMEIPKAPALSFRDEYLSGMLGKKYLKEDLFPSKPKRFIKMKFPNLNKLGKRRKVISGSSSENEIDLKRVKKKKLFDQDKPWRSDEEWYSLDSNLDSSDDNDDEDTNDKTEHSDRKPQSTSFWTYNRSVYLHVLMPSRLISILHIGLEWCQELITMGDLINWAKQGYLPFLAGSTHLLPHMKISVNDIDNLQSRRLPSYQQFIHQTQLLIDYVDMPRMPDVDIHNLTARYIIELNLPLTLLTCIKNLMDIDHFGYKRTRTTKERCLLTNVYKPGVLCYSLIVVMLKLLFGMNDEREWLLDENAEQCESQVESDHDCQPFLFKRWCDYHLKRRMKLRTNPSNFYASADVEVIDDVHAYCEHWKNVTLKAAEPAKCVQSKRNPETMKERLRAKRWALGKLCEAQGSKDEMDKIEKLRDFPFVFSAPSAEDEMHNFCIGHVIKSSESNEWDYVWYADSFARCESYNKRTSAACSFHYLKDKWLRGEIDVSQSYDFLLGLGCELTCAEKPIIHRTVQDVEKKLVCPYLVLKENQTYSSTSWVQTTKLAPKKR